MANTFEFVLPFAMLRGKIPPPSPIPPRHTVRRSATSTGDYLISNDNDAGSNSESRRGSMGGKEGMRKEVEQ